MFQIQKLIQIQKNKILRLKIKYILILGLITCLLNLSWAQQKHLSYEEFLQIVRQFHPIASQASLLNEQANAQVLLARGEFDPVLNYYQAQKNFSGQQYYKVNSPEVRIPTWYGLEVVAGMETLNGQRLDNEQTAGGTNYVGIAIPLAKNLLIDKRRAAMQQAKIFVKMARNEQNALLNQILYEASLSYIDWAKEVEILEILNQSAQVLENRFNFTKQSFNNGERPAVDTLEAFVAWQSVLNDKQSAMNEVQKSQQNLLSFLWQNAQIPFEGPVDFLPATLVNINFAWPDKSLNEWLLDTQNNHPDLLIYQNKLASLVIDKRLKFQEMLPKLDFRYNQLGKGYNVASSLFQAPLFQNNYQYGLKFEMPLRLSAGRAQYKLAQLKIESTGFSQSLKANDLKYKVTAYYNELGQMKQIIALQNQIQNNYQSLVKAEETRLKNGESSLFLINARQSKVIESQQKTIELNAKLLKTKAALQAASGGFR